MDLPPAVILNTIDNFCILFFKDTRQDPKAPPHFYVIFPVNLALRFSVSIITSQIRKREEYYRKTNTKALRSLVKMNNDIFDFLAKESIIDCNHMELLSKEELIKRIDPSVPCQIKIHSGEMPSFLKREIFSAIDQSPLLSTTTKKIIKGIHKDHET